MQTYSKCFGCQSKVTQRKVDAIGDGGVSLLIKMKPVERFGGKLLISPKSSLYVVEAWIPRLEFGESANDISQSPRPVCS